MNKTSKPIAQYAGAMLMYGNSYWTLLTFDRGITNKTIAFPSGGAVTPENGVSLDIGTATSDVTINRASGSATKITAFVTFKKGTATKITFAPDYNFKNNVFDLSDIDTNAFVVESTVSGNTVTAAIPNELLREPGELVVYIWQDTGAGEQKGGRTETFFNVPIKERAQPSDYIYDNNVEYISYYRRTRQYVVQRESISRR